MNIDPNNSVWILFCVTLILFNFTYWIPAVVAFLRNHPYRWLILIANCVFGVTVFGWFLILIWAAYEKPTPR